MTDPKGNNEFCFPVTINVCQAKLRRTLRDEGKQNSLFLLGPVIKSQIKQNTQKLLILLDVGWLQIFIMCKAKVQVVVCLGS